MKIKPNYEQLKAADLKSSTTDSTIDDELTGITYGFGLFELVSYCATFVRIALGGSV